MKLGVYTARLHDKTLDEALGNIADLCPLEGPTGAASTLLAAAETSATPVPSTAIN